MRKTVIALAMCVTLAFSSKSAAFAVSQTTTPASAADVQKSYVEGEALAIVKGDIQLKGPGKVERIAQVSSLALQDVLEEWDDSEVLTKESRRQFEEDETFAIWSVSDRNQTTEEILRELRTDPDVIAAEPNYIAYAANEEEAEAEPEEEAEAVEAETEEPEADNTESTVRRGDLSPMQWSNGIPGSESPAIYTTPLSPTAGYTMEVPGWQEGRTNPNASVNAGGTICIMDTGVDTDHPDLQGVLYEFTPEQQAKYGCGKYGYNASGDGRPENEQKATDSHGTHVAGIIAANWNGEVWRKRDGAGY